MGTPAEKKYLTPREVVERWNGAVVLQTLANWRNKGRGPAYVKFGSRVRYPVARIEEFERENEHLRAANDNRKPDI